MMRFTNYCPKIQKHVQVLILAMLQLVCFSESFAFTFTTPTYTSTGAHIDGHMHMNRHPVTAISRRFGFALGAESNNSENSVILEDPKNNNSQTTDSTTSELTGTGTGTDVNVNVDFNIRSKSTNSKSGGGGGGFFQKFNEASAEGFGTKAKNAMNTMSNGDIVVPLCGNLELRQALANRGIYAGVEYEICSLQLPNTDAEADIDADADADDKKEKEQEQTVNISISTMEGLTPQQQESVSAIIKPAYKLRDHLERTDWPVTVHPSEVPLWLSKTTWEAGTLVGTLSLAVSYLSIAAILAFFVRFAYVPSPSMEPVLNPGNVVLVTRSIPVGFLRPHVGDVVLFDPPSELNRIVSEAASNANEELVLPQKGEQFLKRVVATGGEYVGVKNSSPYVDLSISESQSHSQSQAQSQSKNDNDNDNVGDKKKFRVDVIGPYAQPGLFSQTSWDRPPSQLTKNQYFVAGDNGFRSVDSRVWGPLESRNIFGTAKFVLWPLKDFGPVKDGPIFTIEK